MAIDQIVDNFANATPFSANPTPQSMFHRTAKERFSGVGEE